MPSDPEFRRAIEEIKQRTSLEELVRECVDSDLVRKGNRMWACCPFHDEDTPSFAVGPDPGFWYCFGACREGGDVLQFVQRRHALTFIDALELLAARVGVELPRRRRPEQGEDEGLEALSRAEALFRSALTSSAGRVARDYLASRDIGPNTAEAFGLGWAPASGQALVRGLGESGVSLATLERTGLVRVADADADRPGSGRPYDFFRGRLVIPIRDPRGRTVGFGARRLEDGERAGPKYVNTSETPWFHKGRVIYGYDRALDSIRRGGHMVLMEGYTDVIAAHQAGLAHCCAVLGTATTEDHAALVRRAGARRVTLVFDGDEAGRRAAWRGLDGLLQLEIDLDVVRPPAGSDPADMLAGGDPSGFLAHLELAQDWFEFVCEPLGELAGRDLSRAVDEVLGLLGRLAKPVHRESLLARLAERLGVPADSLREQWRGLPERRTRTAAERATPRDATSAPAQSDGEGSAPRPPAAPIDRRLIQAFKGAVGAALVDSSLLPRLRGLRDECPHPDLLAILDALLMLWDDEDYEGDIDADAVMTALGEHPVRAHVASLVEYVRAADDPLSLLEGELEFLESNRKSRALEGLQGEVVELEQRMAAGDPEAEALLGQALSRLNTLMQPADAAT